MRVLNRTRSRMRSCGRVGFEILETRKLLAGDIACTTDDDASEQGSLLSSVFDYASTASELSKSLLNANSGFYAADAGSTLATAENLGVLEGIQSFSGSVGRGDSADVLRFSLTNAADITIGLNGLRANIDLAVYDGSGQRIAVSQRPGRSAESLTLSLQNGSYYLAIVPQRSAASTYTLSTSVTYAQTSTPTSDDSTTVGETDSGDGTSVTTFPDVAYYGDSDDWNLNSINAPESWAQGYTGQDVIVAVIDTGVDLDHSDLDEQIWVNTDEIVGNGIDDDRNGYVDDIYGWDFVSRDGVPNDENGHGTHVAGTIAAEENGVGATGVAPDATIMPIRVLDRSGYGTDSSVAAGIWYAVQNGADIINLSLGGTFSRLIQSAILYAQQQDVFVVVASGNESASTPSYPAAFSASLTNVISVGAYSSSERLGSFSNDVGRSGAVQVDAPGVSIYSTYLNNRYATFSGTSMAAPHVAGLAALAFSASDTLTASDLRSLIVTGANNDIAGSDSSGGINAAVTVALAAAGQTVSSSSSSSTSSASSFASTSFVANANNGSSTGWFHRTALTDGLPNGSSGFTEIDKGREVATRSIHDSNLSDPYGIETQKDAALLGVLAESDSSANSSFYWTSPLESGQEEADLWQSDLNLLDDCFLEFLV